MKKIILIVLMFSLVVSASAFGANDFTRVPGMIDTYTGDVVIGSRYTYIDKMVITAYTTTKTIRFINGNNKIVLILECPAGETISWPNTDTPAVFPDGLILDVSESELAAGDYIFIWRH